MTTLLVTPAELDAPEVRIEGDAYRHLFRATRLAVGDRVRLADGEGRARWSRVERVGRASALLRSGDAAPPNEAAVSLTLLVATPRPARASWLVEKATEIGVGAIRLLRSERAPRRLGAGSLARLRRVGRAALEQSQRSRLPALSGPHGWEELEALVAGCPERWLLDPRAEREGLGRAVRPAALAVGPEGGWTETERGALLSLGFTPVALGARTLRVETAAVAGCALLLLAGCDPLR